MRFPWTIAIERKIDAEVQRRTGNVALETEKLIQIAIQSETPRIAEAAKYEIVQEMARALRGGSVPAGGYNLDAIVPNSYPQTGGSPYPLYGYDRPIWFATPNSPKQRPDSLISVDTLRRFAKSYDILRSCIDHLKREVQAQPFNISPKDAKDKSDATKKRVQEAEQFFTRKGGLGEKNETRRHYESKIIEDILVVGAYAVYKEKNRKGQLLKALPFESATIRPRMDAYGWPGPDEDWYEQWIMGMVVATFPPEELVYDGLWPVSNSPWFISPVEYLIGTVLSALKSDEWNRVWLTDGNTPGQTISTPETWTPAMIIEYSEYFNSMLSGDSKSRQKSVFLPGGAKMSDGHSRKDQDFKEFDLWLARRTGAIMGVHLAAIGFSGEQYKVTQDGSMDATTQFGASALLDIRKEHYDDLLEDLGFPDLEVTNVAAASESPTEKSKRLLAQSGPWATINESRIEDGKDAIPEGDVIMVNSLTMPLEKALEPTPDPVEADTPPEIRPAKKKTSKAPNPDEERWMRKSLKRVKEGKSAACTFTSSLISEERRSAIEGGLQRCSSIDDVRDLFRADDSEDDEDDEPEKKRKFLVLVLLKKMDATADTVDDLAVQLKNGTITKREFIKQTLVKIEDYHVQAARLGRLKAAEGQVLTPAQKKVSPADIALGKEEAATQKEFLDKFADTVLAGDKSEDQIKAQADMYGQRLVGTANKAWAQSQTGLILWIDMKDDSECEDCIRNADLGPYTPEELPSIPGDGRTECLTRCRCFLENEDGGRSFYDPEDGNMDTRKSNG